MSLNITLTLDAYTGCLDDSGHIIVIVHKLHRFVSIKPASPATHITFIGKQFHYSYWYLILPITTDNGYILVASKNG